MRIVVTGGAGFIGSHVVDAFLDRGDEVLVVDDLSSGKRENVDSRAELVEIGIESSEIRNVFAQFRPDALCHHAAQIDVRRSVADPAYDAEINIVASLKLFEICRELGTRRILFASTGGAIYGEQDVFPAPETHRERPVSPYGVAKLSVERYLHFYAVEHGFRSTVLRYANVYGPRQNPFGEAGVVAIFAHKLLHDEAPTIYGRGEQTRDFVYVGDVAAANRLALERDLSGEFNVGTGVETTINALYDTMRRIAGSSLAAEHAAARGGEQLRSSLDASKIEQATGWRPRTSIEKGLDETMDYFRQHGR